jgi:putative hydrolase of the HAD superfamily
MPALWLFDLDDTILRFSAGQPNFWRHALERKAPELAERHAHLERLIAAVNHEYWSDHARAFWGRQNMHQARRIVARAALGAEGLGSALCDQIADDMTEEKEAHVRPFDGALDVLRQLRESGQRMGLLTNGCSAFQRRKLRRYELEPLFELILIEGELGYGKPDARVFRSALQHFGVSAQDTWMIGDNLDADIAGAQEVGITGIWHDAAGSGLPAQTRVVPGRVIRALSELLHEPS